LAGKKEAPVLDLELELRRPVDPTSNRGSVALKVDPHHGRSTDRAALPTRRLGSSNVLLLLDHPEDPLLGSSDLEVEVEATAATANTAEEEEAIAALRRGNNPEVVTTAMAVTEVDTLDTLVDMEEGATDREVMVLLPEAQLLGSNRMPAMVPQAWTATAFHHLLRRLVESRHHRLLVTSRRLHRPHRSSGLDLEPLEECVDGPRVLACGVLNQ
jgi:CheY-like chemotaxis protein